MGIMKVQATTRVHEPMPTLGSVCKRGSVTALDEGRIALREDSSHIALEMNMQDLDPSRLYVWIKQKYILILGRKITDRRTHATQSFVRTVQLPHAVEGAGAVVEKHTHTLHIVAPKVVA